MIFLFKGMIFMFHVSFRGSNWCLHNLKKSTWTCSSEKKHLLDKQTVFGGFKRQIPVPPPNHQLWNRAHYDYRKMRSDQPMPKWTVNLKRDFQQLDHETNNKVHRGVLLYEMLFATTPFTGRCNFSGWWIFGGKATRQSFLEGSDPLFVCKGSCLIRYPKWQWTSWKLEDIPSFAKIPKHHQKEQLSSSSWFSSSLNVSESPQLHSPVGRSSSRQPAYHATCCEICPANEDQQWDNHKLAGILGNQ